jgi:hypothetical protein
MPLASTGDQSLDFGNSDINISQEIDEPVISESHISSTGSDDDSAPSENGQDLRAIKFLQLPKARQELINNYKKDFEKAIASPSETLVKLVESGSSMLKSYREPVDRAIESCKQPVNNVIQSGTIMINSFQDPLVSIQNVLISSSDVLTTKISSLTAENFPTIGTYVPWLSDKKEQGKKE